MGVEDSYYSNLYILRRRTDESWGTSDLPKGMVMVSLGTLSCNEKCGKVRQWND